MQNIEEVVYRLIYDQDYDHWLQPHHRAVERVSVILAEKLGLETDRISLAARCHDVGKQGISDAIWTKAGPLTATERKIVALHSEIGEQLVSLYLQQGIPRIVRRHQEWFDGQGYPDGLAGRAIPIEARIIAVADAYDSLTSDRPYRKGTSPLNALIELWRYAGTQFDPLIVKVIEDVIREGKLDPHPDISSIQMADSNALQSRTGRRA